MVIRRTSPGATVPEVWMLSAWELLAAIPSYVTARTDIAAGLVTAEINAGDLHRLQADPAVESMSISRRMSAID